MAPIQSGTVTFLLKEIENSTDLAERYPDEMPSLLAAGREMTMQEVVSLALEER
jgi:hypothetical protein